MKKANVTYRRRSPLPAARVMPRGQPQATPPGSRCYARLGFTLIELIIALGIFTASVTILATYVVQGYTANRFAIETSDAIEYARRGIQAMAKEVREARFAENGDFPIVAAAAQSLIFYSDIDSDQSIEKVRYFLQGTTLLKGKIEPVGTPATYPAGNETMTTVAEYVRNGSAAVFTYYGGLYPAVGTPLSTPTDPNLVKLVTLHLEINIDPNTAPKFFALDEAIQVRNLKENL